MYKNEKLSEEEDSVHIITEIEIKKPPGIQFDHGKIIA
jgi:hypothetical protein